MHNIVLNMIKQPENDISCMWLKPWVLWWSISPDHPEAECERVTHRRETKTYIVYCNIFCIINFHLHLPIKPPNPEKKKKKKGRDEGRRGSDWRSSVHEPRTVEVALLIIGTYKKNNKKNTHHNGGKKNSSSILLHDDSSFVLPCQSLVCFPHPLPPPSPLKKELLKTSVCTTRCVR